MIRVPAIALVLVFFILVATVGTSLTYAAETHTPSTPAVTIVQLPNGHKVTCIDFGEWGTCDLLGFTSGPH